MRQEVELYLMGRSVEFNEPPEILFSYIRTDYTDPTVLRNSYSKTLTIEGTPNNNQLFNSIYRMDNITDLGTFNPAKRIEFQLFSNGDILEQGYAKLDRINRDGKNISYDITLYGGLGEFLYNLSYDQTAEGSDTSRGGGEGRRLSSLIYYDEIEPNKEFDFEITKDTVAEAWEALEKGTGDTKWKYINFAPAYNGVPEDFDADKVLINTQASSVPVTYNNNGETGKTTGFPTSIIQNDTTYRTYNNYAIGKLPKPITEWESRDLRSYLQRPVLSMKGFLNAIANPANNGGYEVDLDSTFFNSDNPYYENAWVTLPLLKKDETETGRSAKTVADNDVLSVSSYLGENYDVRYYLQGITPGATYNGVDLTFQIKDVISGMPNEVYTSFADYNIGFFGRDAAYYSSIFVQLVGEDNNGTPIAASPIYNFTSPFGLEKGWWFWSGTKPPTEYFTRKDYGISYTPVVETRDVVMLGRFVKTSGNNYVWKNNDGNISAFTVSLTDNLDYSRIYFRVTKCHYWRANQLNCFEEQIFSGLTTTSKAPNILGGYTNRALRRCNFLGYGPNFNSDTITATTAVTGVEVIGSQVRYTEGSDVVRSGNHISKGDLLNFDGTPCDYLLSYCKLFNLFLFKDIYAKKIYIRTRDSFYNKGIVDLEKFIDRSKEIKVSPLAMNSRWYDFAYPEDEKCAAAEEYDFNYGVEYGKNKVQTTYEFDSTAVDLFKDNIYQNSVDVQESSKYFTLRTTSGKTVPTFLYDTVNYELFSTPSNGLNSCALLPPADYSQTGYTSANGREDWFPKLQLRASDGSGIDGTNVLCFYGGFKTSPFVGSQQTIYYLTDDVAEMYVLNGETPCWIWSKNEYNGSQRIAKGMTKLPVFSRMMYDSSGSKIDYTWDFGRVRSTYVPVTDYNDKSTIFERWWADYIADLYSADTRVVECFVKMEGKVVGDWLRYMYWWDNNYWVLTEINGYNITSYATTKCKFVRVNDISNYTSGITPPAVTEPYAVLVPEKYIIAATGETINAYVKTSYPELTWHIEYPSYITPSIGWGTGSTPLTLTFPANPNDDGRDIRIGTYFLTEDPTSTNFWQNGQDTVQKDVEVLSGNRFIFNYEAQSNTLLTISYRNRDNDTITVNKDADWLTTGTITWDGDSAMLPFSMTESTTASVRSVTLVVSAVSGQLSSNVIMDQLPESVEISNNGGSQTITLRNTAFTLSPMDGYWATITTSGSDITFTAPANVEDEPRYENVQFVVSGEGFYSSASTQLVQSGGGGQLIVTPTAITAEWSGGDKMIVVQCMSNWSITSAPEWVNLTPSAGTSGQTVIIANFPEYTGNSARTGTITFSDGTRTASTQVTQNQRSSDFQLSVTPPSIHMDYSGTSTNINVYSPIGRWYLVSKPDWITLSQTSGYAGNALLTAMASENRGLSARTGEIVFRDWTNSTGSCQVLQDNFVDVTITYSPSAITIPFSGGSGTFTVSSDCDYNVVKGSANWYTVSPQSGHSGSTLFAVSSSTINTGNSNWTSSISIIGPNGTAGTVSVTENNQGDSRISYTADTSNVAASGESRTITIDATQFINSSLTITVVGAEGATYSYASGLTRGTITVNIPENLDTTREISVIVTGRQAATSNEVSAVIQYQQNEYVPVQLSYTADTSTVDFTGETRTITIDTSNIVASSVTASIQGASGASISYNNGVATVLFPANYGDERTFAVHIGCRMTTGGTGYANVVYTQERYIPGDIIYTADTSTVAASGETRLIIIEPYGFQENSFGVSSITEGATYEVNGNLVNVTFPVNRTSTGRTFEIVLSGTALNDTTVLSSPIEFEQAGKIFTGGTLAITYYVTSTTEPTGIVNGNYYRGYITKAEYPQGTEINLDNIGDYYWYTFPSTGLQTVYYTWSTGELKGFQSLSNVVSAVLPDDIEYIGSSCFFDCQNLESVTINSTSNLYGIKENAFWNCVKLTEITFPPYLTILGAQNHPSPFTDCRISAITSYATVPPVFKSGNFFPNGVTPFGTLYYPVGSDYSEWFVWDENPNLAYYPFNAYSASYASNLKYWRWNSVSFIPGSVKPTPFRPSGSQIEIIAVYNVTQTTGNTNILGNDDPEYIGIEKAVLLNGNEIPISTGYTFSTTGLQTVKYTLSAPYYTPDVSLFEGVEAESITIPEYTFSLGHNVFKTAKIEKIYAYSPVCPYYDPIDFSPRQSVTGGTFMKINGTASPLYTTPGNLFYPSEYDYTRWLTTAYTVQVDGYTLGNQGWYGIPVGPTGYSATGLTLSIPDSTIFIGDQLTASTTVSPIGATAVIYYTSSDTLKATVNENTGVITTLSAGEVTITANDRISGLQDSKSITVHSSANSVTATYEAQNGVTQILNNDGVSGFIAAFYNGNRIPLTTGYTFPSSGTHTINYVLPDDSSIWFNPFSGITSLKSVILPNSVEELGDRCFSGCSFSSITFPSVTQLGQSCFGNCTGLTSMVLPSGLTSIGFGAFQLCTSLTSITIPSGVTTIERYAFSNCTSLSEITTYIQNPPNAGDTVFVNTPTQGTLYYPSGSDYSYWLYYLGYQQGQPGNWTGIPM